MLVFSWTMTPITHQTLFLPQTSNCPCDTGLNFGGSYVFSAEFNCMDNSNNSNVCNDYFSDESLSITLDSADLVYSVYDIDWNGDVSFFSDSTLNTNSSSNELAFGDTMYVKLVQPMIFLVMKYLIHKLHNVMYVRVILVMMTQVVYY